MRRPFKSGQGVIMAYEADMEKVKAFNLKPKKKTEKELQEQDARLKDQLEKEKLRKKNNRQALLEQKRANEIA
jgi:hypothetical protein